jgi:hypothetical protein
MNKKLVASLAAAMVLGLAGTSFAANPFADVPTKHWSYDAVSKLAAAGIVEGYSDGTFKGDKTITRYEMAQIVARAIFKEDKADKEQKALIEKLAAEYKAELDNLGVRVSTLETKADKFTINPSTLRLRFDTHKDDGASKTTDEHVNLDLLFGYKVNDNWSIQGESEYQRGINKSTLNTSLTDQFEQLYVTGPVGGATVKAGRFSLYSPYGLIYDDKLTGVEAKFGKVVKVTLDAGKSNTVEEAKDIFTGSLVNSGNNAADITAVTVEAPLSPVTNAKVAYYRYANGTDNNNGYIIADGTKINYYTVSLDTKFAKDFTLVGAYSKSDADSAESNKSYLAKITYKMANYSVPGSYDVFALYRHSPSAAQFSNTDDWVSDVKGFRVGIDYVLDKNIGLTAWYSDGKYVATGEKTKWYRAEFDFKF